MRDMAGYKVVRVARVVVFAVLSTLLLAGLASPAGAFGTADDSDDSDSSERSGNSDAITVETASTEQTTFDTANGSRMSVTMTAGSGDDRGGVSIQVSTVTAGTPEIAARPRVINHPVLWTQYCVNTGRRLSYTPGSEVSFTLAREEQRDLLRAIFRVDCEPVDGGVWTSGEFELANWAAEDLILGTASTISVDELLAEVVIQEPSIASSPPFDSRPSLVNTETWFWVTDPWVDRTETVNVNGIEIDVTATPLRVVWDVDEPGSNGPVVCEGPGEVWGSGLDSTTCGYTFTQSSAGHGPNDAFTATATAVYEYSWSLNGVDQGVFATIDAATEFEIQVAEIQAVSR